MWLVHYVGFLIAGWVWALSSAVGSAPDDDYHMASIWCPTPLESSGCLVEYNDLGQPVVKVPTLIALAVCYQFDPDASGECQLDFEVGKSKRLAWTMVVIPVATTISSTSSLDLPW